MPLAHIADPFHPKRRATRQVFVGDVGVGGGNPIRVQSMTTTDTLDTKGTADQCERLADAGCEIVRITAPSIKEAENLEAIQRELRRRGVRVPLVADIHYTPNAALIAAEHVEKVRINPGNYADKKKFEVREYSDAQWEEETARVAERFRPLVRRCQALGRSMRIGTNHGSLADRIMNRFGDTPAGMVESALEFLEVCEDEGYLDVVFSMKSSNAQVAIQAYRLLAARLEERSPGTPSYPFHVGVTEAGDGEDGRIKSAIGIGSLLVDGFGDTIRVSLTEDPVREVPVARALARRFVHVPDSEGVPQKVAAGTGEPPRPGYVDDPFRYARRSTRSVGGEPYAIGGAHPVRVELELGAIPSPAGPAVQQMLGSLAKAPEIACEGLVVDVADEAPSDALAELLRETRSAGLDVPVAARASAARASKGLAPAARAIVSVSSDVGDDALAAAAGAAARDSQPVEWQILGDGEALETALDRALAASAKAGLDDLLVSVGAGLPVHALRRVVAQLGRRRAADVPVVLRPPPGGVADEEALLAAAVALGAPLCDGIGDAVAMEVRGDAGEALGHAYRILQGARLRTSWTEYISCPSCGRTLFDLEETTARIKSRTQHLVGVKIAVMGCIVNGPGEMADADFGYVGSGPGQVNLYVGKELVERKVPEADADDRLEKLIRDHGRWSSGDSDPGDPGGDR